MPADASGAPVRADGRVSVGSRAARSGWTYLELLLVQLHLLQLVPDGLHPPAPVVPLQEAQLQAAETLLQILQRVAKLKDQQSEISTSACANKHFSAPKSQKVDLLLLLQCVIFRIKASKDVYSLTSLLRQLLLVRSLALASQLAWASEMASR